MSKGGVVEMKDDQLPILYLARHRETAWLSAQHPGLTDLPLTERGEQLLDALANAYLASHAIR